REECTQSAWRDAANGGLEGGEHGSMAYYVAPGAATGRRRAVPMSSPKRFSHSDTALLRHRKSVVAMCGSPIALSLVLMLATLLSGEDGMLVSLPHLLIIGAISLYYTLRKNPLARKVAPVEVDEE